MKICVWCAVLIAVVLISACSSTTDKSSPPADKRALAFERTQALLSERQYDVAYNESHRALQDGTGDPDLALYNLGMISAHSANPKKNYARALSYFRMLVKDYPNSQLVEPAKTWIQVLDEYHKVSEEKRLLAKEREDLMAEKEKLKYANEKSRQVDVEIEKRRRETLRK